MKQSLQNLKKIVQLALARIEIEQIDDAVIVIGNTGCGKSTLLSALYHGSEALELKYENKRIQGRGGEKIRKVLVGIDYKDEFIQQQPGAFEIGHSKVQSHTFLPTFQRVESDNDE